MQAKTLPVRVDRPIQSGQDAYPACAGSIITPKHLSNANTVALTKALSVLTQAGSFGGSNVQLKYSKDY